MLRELDAKGIYELNLKRRSKKNLQTTLSRDNVAQNGNLSLNTLTQCIPTLNMQSDIPKEAT